MPGKMISIDVKPRQVSLTYTSLLEIVSALHFSAAATKLTHSHLFQRIEAGQRLAVVEAMKMQNVLRAQREGRVKKIRCQVGDVLEVDAIIMDMDD